MHDIVTAIGQFFSQFVVHLLHALGIKDRAFADLRVVVLGTFIVFGLLVIGALKIIIVRAQEAKAAADAASTPAPRRTPAQRVRTLLAYLAGLGVLLAVSLLFVLSLNS